MYLMNRSRARGAVSGSLLFSILIVVAIAVAVWLLVVRPHLNAVHQEQTDKLMVSRAATTQSAPAPANVAAMTTDQLLSEAAKAVQQERLLSPAGDNAFEFYLRVLKRQPDDQVAKQALRETFPIAANVAEQAINNRDFAEAQREINLLAEAAPDNYTLTILRSKLDAQRKTATQQQQQAAAALLAKHQATQRKQHVAAAAAKQQAAPPATGQTVAKSQPKTSNTPESQPAKPAVPKPAPVKIQNAVRVSYVRPRYPVEAIQRNMQGWVDVQFEVNDQGRVNHVRVIRAQPAHIFDRAAILAVERWRYRPALRNGEPFPVTMRRRIEFKLGN